MLDKIKLVVAALSAVSAMFLVAWYGFLEPPWLSYRGLPWPMMKASQPYPPGEVAQLRPGEVIEFKNGRCNSSGEERSYITSRYLVRVDRDDQEDYRFDSNPTTAAPGCTGAISTRNRVPDGTPPGLYYFRGTAEIASTWRRHSVSWRTQNFKVLAKDAP